MTRGRFDERCPHCGAKIDCYTMFTNSDYQTNFRFVCGECDGTIECDVHSVPEFELSIPETPEEYQARRLRMMQATKDVIQQMIMERPKE